MNSLDEMDLQEMVSYPKSVTGVSNVLFISTKGHARHGPRIKIAINPPNRIDPRSETASIRFDGSIANGQIDAELLQQVRRFIEQNRSVLLDYWDYRINTEELRERLKAI